MKFYINWYLNSQHNNQINLKLTKFRKFMEGWCVTENKKKLFMSCAENCKENMFVLTFLQNQYLNDVNDQLGNNEYEF